MALSVFTWIRFAVWFCIGINLDYKRLKIFLINFSSNLKGLVVYFVYGRQHSTLAREKNILASNVKF